MASSRSGKYENIFNILQLHFRWKVNAPEHLLCGVCGYILIDACQAACGCNFCLACIKNMLANGTLACPGSTELCKEERLSVYVTDFKANNQIKNLVLKCPLQSCSHACKLVDLGGHLTSCSKRCIACPFREIGCNDGEIVTEDMSDHLRTEGFNHNRILADVINNINVEMDRLKRNEEANRIKLEGLEAISVEYRTEIGILKRDLSTKDKLMNEVNEQISSIKVETKDIVQQAEQVKQSLQNTVNENRIEILTRMEKNRSIDEELQSMKRENLDLVEQIRELRLSNTSIIQNQEFIETEFITRNIENSKHCTEMNIQINEVEKWLDKQIDGTFVWKIDKISEKMKRRTQLFSGCFYSRKEAYKMNLQYFSDAKDDNLSIRFIIRVGERHPFHQWPFRANATVRIVNKACPQTSKFITKCCVVGDPLKDKDKCTRSDDFIFQYSELYEVGLLRNDCLIIECSIDE